MSNNQRKLNLEDYGPVSSFSTSIISGLLVGLLVQNFIGFGRTQLSSFCLLEFMMVSEECGKFQKSLNKINEC